MNKSEFVKHIANQHNITQDEANKVIGLIKYEVDFIVYHCIIQAINYIKSIVCHLKQFVIQLLIILMHYLLCIMLRLSFLGF